MQYIKGRSTERPFLCLDFIFCGIIQKNSDKKG